MNFADAACEPGLLEAVMPGKNLLVEKSSVTTTQAMNSIQNCSFASLQRVANQPQLLSNQS